MIDNIREENSLGHIHGFFKNKELQEGKAVGMDFIENETDSRDAVLCIRTKMDEPSSAKPDSKASFPPYSPSSHMVPTSSDIADENFAEQRPPQLSSDR